MRTTLAALLLVLTAAVGTFAVPAPARAAQTSDAKVVIIVGATHSATTKYRGYADQAYAEAIKYTPNVVKVYSPNATWSKVKSATVGASVVIYFGHGNGWPSPYTVRPELHDQGRVRPERDGRQWRQQQQVLRRAVVATPRSRAERGRPAPPPLLRGGQLRARQRRRRPRRVAKQRVDNYGAGLPQGRRERGDRRRPPRPGRLPASPVHDRPDAVRPVAHAAQLPRQRVLVRVGAHAGQDRADGSGYPDVGLLPLVRRQPERDHDARCSSGAPASPAARRRRIPS